MYKPDDIYTWLQNPTDFQSGEKIFNFFSKVSFDKKFPSSIPDRIRLANLKYALNKILKEQKQNLVFAAKKEVILEVEPNSLEEHKELLDASNLPFNLQKKWILKGKIYKEIGILRQDLFSDSKEVRASAANKIVELTKQNRKLWEELNYFQQYGVEMKPAEDTSVDIDVSTLSVSELLQLSKNLPSWITKEKRKIELEIDVDKKNLRIKNLDINEKKLEAVKLRLSQL